MLLTLLILLTQDPAASGAPARIPFEVTLDELRRPAPVDTTDPRSIPARAFTDPTWWEQSQCGPEPEETCRRAARNRLAMARAERMEAAPVEPPPRRAPTCRTVMQRSESGFGGSVTRVCGDGDNAERALESHQRLMDDLRPPAPEPCDRPASGETQDDWIARCRALP